MTTCYRGNRRVVVTTSVRADRGAGGLRHDSAVGRHRRTARPVGRRVGHHARRTRRDADSVRCVPRVRRAELVELLVDFFCYVGRMHGPYARGREFSRAHTDRSPPAPSTSGVGRGRAGAGGRASYVCQCGARYCEAAERRVSLSLTSRRRRCASCCDCACARTSRDTTRSRRGQCACARSRAAAAVSHVDNLYDSVLPRSAPA